MKCAHCPSEIQPGNKFCGNCGNPALFLCPKCKAENPPSSKFCGMCGTGLNQANSVVPNPAAESEQNVISKPEEIDFKNYPGERKYVTVLFADVKGSTALVADRDPEETRALLEPALKIMMDSVHEFGGTVIKSAGDGIMALFGAPIALEHHTLRACYAALSMQKRTQEASDSLGIRVGLNAGEVIVDIIGSDTHKEYDALGPAVNLASRMEQLAEPGTIQLTRGTLDLVEDKVQAQSKGKQTVKGFNEPIEVFILKKVIYEYSDLQKKKGSKLSPFVSRETELFLLNHKIALVKAGHGHIIALHGDPGEGKSRLLYEFMNSNDAKDFLKYEGHGYLIQKHVPFYSLKRFMQNIFSSQGDGPEDIQKKIDLELEKDLKSLKGEKNVLYSLLDIQIADEEWSKQSPQFKRIQTMNVMINFLIAKSAKKGLIISFDDVQWLDNETLVFLDRFASQLKKEKILLLLAYRSEFKHSWNVDHYLTEIHIDSLGSEAILELSNHILGNDPELGNLKEKLAETCEGNPFFLEEMILSLYHHNVLSGEPGHYRLEKLDGNIVLPNSIQAVMASRVDTLSMEEKKVLLYSSVLGKNVIVSLLNSIIDVHGENLEQILAILTEKDFLEEKQKHPEHEFSFVNNITLEVVYNSLLKQTKKQIHVRVLEQLEEMYPETYLQTNLKAIHAFRGDLWEKAFKYYAFLGSEGYDVSAIIDALANFNKAFECYEHLTPTKDIDATFISLRFKKFHICVWLGRFDELESIMRTPIEIATKTNNIKLKTSLSLASVTVSSITHGDYENAEKIYRESLNTCKELNDNELLVQTSFYGIHALTYLGNYKQSLECYRVISRFSGESMERDARSGDPFSPATVFYASIAAGELGDFETLASIESLASKVASIIRPSLETILIHGALGMVYFFRGNFNRAIEHFNIVFDNTEKTGINVLVAPISSVLGNTLALKGELELAKKYLDQCYEVSKKMNFAFKSALLPSYMAEGYLQCKAIGNVRACLEKLSFLVDTRKQKTILAKSLCLKGELALVEDNVPPEDIESFFNKAIQVNEDLELKPHIAHCQKGLYKLYQKLGNTEKAEKAYVAAYDYYQQNDIKYWLDYMNDLKKSN